MIASIDLTAILSVLFAPFCYGHYYKKNIDLLVPSPFWVWSKESYFVLGRFAPGCLIGMSIIGFVGFLTDLGMTYENIFGQGASILSLSFILLGVFAALFSRPKFIIPPLLKDSPSLFAKSKDKQEYFEKIRKKTNNWTYQNNKKND